MSEFNKLLRVCISCGEDISNLPLDRVYCLYCFMRPEDYYFNKKDLESVNIEKEENI